MLVPGQSEKGITTVHQVTGQQGVGVHDGWQGVNDWAGMEVDDKKHLTVQKRGDASVLMCAVTNSQSITCRKFRMEWQF